MESYRFLSFLFFLLISATFISSSLAYTFKVGGQDGWVLHPSVNYNSWAGRNRFLVNDTLHFKYKEGADYVLQVGKDAYDQCNVHHSWRKMRSGNSFFTFDKSGPFYFISGKKDNCNQGQKLHVVVLSTGHKPPVSPYPVASPVPSVSPASSPAPVSPVPSSAPSTSPAPASHVPASAPSLHVAPATSPAPVILVPAPAPSTNVAPAITPAPASQIPASAPSTHVSPALSPSTKVPAPAPTPKLPAESPAPATHVPSPHSAPLPHPSPSTSPTSSPAPEFSSSPPAIPPSQQTPPVSSPSSSEIRSDSPAPAPNSATSLIGQSNIFVPAVTLVLSLIYVINVV